MRRSASGLVTITGGKLTTYRGWPPTPSTRSCAARLDAGTGPAQSARSSCGSAAPTATTAASTPPRTATRRCPPRRPLRRRGADVARARSTRDPSLGEPLVPGLPYLRAEAVYAARHEMARSRRRRAVPPHPGPAARPRRRPRRVADDVAALLAPELGWDDAEQAAQAAAYRALVAHERDARRHCPRPRSTRLARRVTPCRSTAPGQATPRHRRSPAAGGTAITASAPSASTSATTSSGACATRAPTSTTDAAELAEASRDWWPLAMTGRSTARSPASRRVVAGPPTPTRSPRCCAICNEAGVPVTAAGGRSGVCGARVPVHGGVVLDLTGLSGIVDVDDDVARARRARRHLRRRRSRTSCGPSHGITLGHWPQSIELSTVGGWLACRGAGQYSTRYGKIEDMVVGLDVVLADGRAHHAPAARRGRRSGPTSPSSSSAPRARSASSPAPGCGVHPAPPHEAASRVGVRSTSSTGSTRAGAILRRGATPAVLRLYDAIEADRSYKTGDRPPRARSFDEGDPASSTPSMRVVAEECDAPAPSRIDAALVEQLARAPQRRLRARGADREGFVVDTMEIAGRWPTSRRIYDATPSPRSRPCPARWPRRPTSPTATPTAPASTSRSPARSTPTDEDRYYVAMWDAGTASRARRGGALSHHHGVGLNRGAVRAPRRSAPAFDVLVALKTALDPQRHPQPGQARPADSVRRGRLAVSIDWRRSRSPGLDRRARARRAGRRRSAQSSSTTTRATRCSSSRRDHRRRARRRVRRRLEAARRAADPRRGGGVPSRTSIVQALTLVVKVARGSDAALAGASTCSTCC